MTPASTRMKPEDVVPREPRSLRAGLLTGKLVSVWAAGRGHSPQQTVSSLAETWSFRS